MTTLDDERKRLLKNQIKTLDILSNESSLIDNSNRVIAKTPLPEIIPLPSINPPFSASIDIQIRRYMIYGPYFNIDQPKTIDSDVFKTKCYELLVQLIENGLGAIIIKEAFESFLSSPKQEYALFALALCAQCKSFVIIHENEEKDEIIELFNEYLTKLHLLGLKSINIVIRSGGHLFDFIHFCQMISKNYDKKLSWGRAMKREVSKWYKRDQFRKIVVEILKYRKRHGWTHKDLLKCCHLSSKGLYPIYDILFRFIITGKVDYSKIDLIHVPKDDPGEETIQRMSRMTVKTLECFIELQKLKKYEDLSEALRLIKEGELPIQCVPSELLQYPDVWKIVEIPYLQQVKSVCRLASLGVLSGDNPENDEKINNFINDCKSIPGIHYSRIHPMNYLISLKSYEKCHSRHLKWTINSNIFNGLNYGIIQSFFNRIGGKKIDKNILICINNSKINNIYGICSNAVITPIDLSLTLTKLFIEKEANVEVVTFDNKNVENLNFNQKMSINQMKELLTLSLGEPKSYSVDYTLPIKWSIENDKKFDIFIVFHDSKPYYECFKFSQIFNEYKQIMNLYETKMVTVGLTNDEFTLSNPNDEYMMENVAFDVNFYSNIMKFINTL